MAELGVTNKLVNLEYSLYREFLSTNRIGGYMCSTITCCNTRKYHGLMICPVKKQNNRNFLLLSSVDETLVQNEYAFNLAVHQFPGTFFPKGNKYIIGFSYSPIPSISYMVGDILFKKEMIWMHSRNHLLVRYSLLQSSFPVMLQVRPMLAYRDIDELSKANSEINEKVEIIDQGIKCTLYDDLPTLYMQTSTKSQFISDPDWYYNYEYQREKEMGRPYSEDLFTNGFFQLSLNEGESVVFSYSTNMIPSRYLTKLFEEETSRRSNKTTFRLCLEHAARQFMMRKKDGVEILSNYPWRDMFVRDAFIALPDLTLSNHNPELCIEALDHLCTTVRDGLFPETFQSRVVAADTSLWFFYTLQRLESVIPRTEIWRRYGAIIKNILTAYSYGTAEGAIEMHDNGLIWVKENSYCPLIWKADKDSFPENPRNGYVVEICALWYNAVCYALELADEVGDFVFLDEWKDFDDRIRKSFNEVFVIQDEQYLADYVNDSGANIQIRANQLIACSLKYKPISDTRILSVLDVVARHLRTPRGIRTLSPTDLSYIGICNMTNDCRGALANGGITLWLTAFYIQALLHIRKDEAEEYSKKLIKLYEEDFLDFGITNMAEMYEGDPPYHPRGAVSCATSVAAMLNILDIVQPQTDENKIVKNKKGYKL